MSGASDARRLVAEFLGTALLLVAVVGSGIITSSDGAASTQLFQHAVAVGLALTALILVFGPVSGAHFNPVVTLVDWWFGGLPGVLAARYVAVQVTGAVVGTVLTHLSFGLSVATLSGNTREGIGMAVAETIATGGLLLVIFALVRTGQHGAIPGAVGAWIAAAIFFTSSASFANPAVTLARALTDTYTGIAPMSVPAFLVGQALGMVGSALLIRWMYAPTPAEAQEVVVPTNSDDPRRP